MLRRVLYAVTAGVLPLAWSAGAIAQAERAGPRFVDELPAGVEVEQVARARCTTYAFTASVEENLERCRAELVGEAELEAGDFIVITSREIGVSFCQRCTRMWADVYRVVNDQEE